MIASPMVSIAAALLVLVGLPLDAWLVALPAAVRHRNSIAEPTYKHDVT
jgi:hypothetical protein